MNKKLLESDMENIKILRYSLETYDLLSLAMLPCVLPCDWKQVHPKSLPYYFVSVDVDSRGAHIQLNKFDGRYGSTSQCVSRSTTKLFDSKNDKEMNRMFNSGLPILPELCANIRSEICALCNSAMVCNQRIIASVSP